LTVALLEQQLLEIPKFCIFVGRPDHSVDVPQQSCLAKGCCGRVAALRLAIFLCGRRDLDGHLDLQRGNERLREVIRQEHADFPASLCPVLKKRVTRLQQRGDRAGKRLLHSLAVQVVQCFQGGKEGQQPLSTSLPRHDSRRRNLKKLIPEAVELQAILLEFLDARGRLHGGYESLEQDNPRCDVCILAWAFE
jgi:hypothetical protein